VSPDYVSHIEIQLGRARRDWTWSENLVSLLVEEFSSALSPQKTQANQFRAFSGTENDELVCVGIVGFSCPTGAESYAVIEDFVVHSEKRGAQLGTKALEWVEASATELGIGMLFCETGASNVTAQRFFQQRSFRPTSVVFKKILLPAVPLGTSHEWGSKLWHLGGK
jgi:N-acetylglutamate synthase-like GNAT family acetyltransferase